MTNQQNVCAQFAYWLRIGKLGEKEHSEAWIYDSIAFSIIQCGLAEKYAEDPLETLADLIDPTCKPIEAGYNIVCSECEADIYDDDLYCPNCGARVVRDEA